MGKLHARLKFVAMGFVTAVAVFAVDSAHADLFWNNVVGGSFNTAANWSPQQTPTASDIVRFNVAGAYTVGLQSASSAASLRQSDGDVTLDLNQRSLTLSGTPAISVGLSPGFNPRLTITDGSLGIADLAIGTSESPTHTPAGPGTLRVQASSLSTNAVRVGEYANGALQIQAGSMLSNTAQVAVNGAANGTVSLSNGSFWTVLGTFQAGMNQGDANVSITSNSSLAPQNFFAGTGAGGSTSVLVDGIGSSLSLPTFNSQSVGRIELGSAQSTAMTVSNGATVDSRSTVLAKSGQATISGAGSSWSNRVSTVLGGDTTGGATLNVTSGGFYRAGNSLTINNNAQVNVAGGSLLVSQDPPTTALAANTAEVRQGSTLTLAGGTLNVGSLLLQSAANMQGVVNGAVTNQSVLTVPVPDNASQPGLEVQNSFTQSSGGWLQIPNVTNTSTSAPAIHVDGPATVGGLLKFGRGAFPLEGQQYPVIQADSVSGTFSNVVPPTGPIECNC